MVKTCKKYWNSEIADRIVQLKGIRFDNPQFSLTTTFDRSDFTKITPVENLFVVGTDQGFMGVVGAMTSGVAIAGHLLQRAGHVC